jgi:hypothetical protein
MSMPRCLSRGKDEGHGAAPRPSSRERLYGSRIVEGGAE